MHIWQPPPYTHIFVLAVRKNILRHRQNSNEIICMVARRLAEFISIWNCLNIMQLARSRRTLFLHSHGCAERRKTARAPCSTVDKQKTVGKCAILLKPLHAAPQSLSSRNISRFQIKEQKFDQPSKQITFIWQNSWESLFQSCSALSLSHSRQTRLSSRSSRLSSSILLVCCLFSFETTAARNAHVSWRRKGQYFHW